jgi:hypothetical protein
MGRSAVELAADERYLVAEVQTVASEEVQHIGGHAEARTTNLYDMRKRNVSRNIVGR